MEESKKMIYSSRFFFNIITAYRIFYTRDKKWRIIYQNGNIFSMFPLLTLGISYWFDLGNFVVSTNIFVIILYYVSIFMKFPRGYFSWNSEEILYRPHIFEISHMIIPREKRVHWKDVAEINIVKPLHRISIYGEGVNIEFVIEGSFASEISRMQVECALLAFARYARLKLRNKPNVLWCT